LVAAAREDRPWARIVGMCSMEAIPFNRKAQKCAEIADAKLTSDGRRAL
jgi:hypothetical protein